MRIRTLSILAGSEACNARCPYCISKMTPPLGVQLKEPQVNWRNFKIACLLAQRGGVSVVMLTGKGEPTLFPQQITRYLRALAPFEFPLIELQSNGVAVVDRLAAYAPHLRAWYRLGLTTIAVSVAHHLPEKNRALFLPHQQAYIDLPLLVRLLHDHGFSVRLTSVLANSFIDNAQELEAFIEFAKAHEVEQCTVRPLNHPQRSRDQAVQEWTARHALKPEQLAEIRSFLDGRGKLLMTLAHGAQVYDVEGQNICLTDSLTIDPNRRTCGS